MSRLLAAQRALTVPGWVKEDLSRKAQAIPSLDLRFAENKSLVDAATGANLVTFTRASSGTYVGSDGVLKTATTNLLLRSEEFDNAAAWQNQGSTDTANIATAPNGTLTADEVIEDSSTSNHYITQSFTSTTGIVYTFSCYVKAANRTFCFLVANGAGTVQAVSVNLSTGVASSATGSPSNITSVSIGNGWYRVSFTYTSGTTGAVGHEVRLSTDGVWANRSYTGNGTGSVYVWGAQLEQSSTVGEYIPTTSTTNSAPRFDHNPTTDESLGLLVEEQRTNSIRNNTMVGAVAGTPGTAPTNWVFTTAAGITRELVGVGTENGINYIDYRFSGTATGSSDTQFDGSSVIAALSGQSWTSSAYVKLQAGSLANATITQIVAENSAAGGFLAASTQNITPTSSALGQQRASLSRTLNNASTAYVITALRVTSAGAIDITLRIGLPQLEQGAFATSVIPATGTTATRSADVASITGTNFSSWYRQDEGTVFAFSSSFGATNSNRRIAFATDGTTSNRFGLLYNSSNAPQIVVSSAGTVVANPNVALTGANYAIAAAYKLDDYAITAAGSNPGTDTAGALPVGINQLSIGSQINAEPVNGTIRRLTYWPQRLGNSTLQSITQ